MGVLGLIRIRTARAYTEASLNIGSLPGVYNFQKNGQPLCRGESKYDFCLNNSIFVEISDAGNNNTLDSQEAWSKSYIDPSRLNDAVIGIYDGKYASGRFDSNGSKSTFNDNNADDGATFEFFTAEDVSRSTGGFDEIPCEVDGEDKPFLRLSSNTMASESWKTIDVAEAVKRRHPRCTATNADNGLVTRKTNKIVIFIKTTWKKENGEGRVNAFKVGTAYNGSNAAGRTGYYSRYASATQPRSRIPADQVGMGQYAVQSRDQNARYDQGRYYFSFAPDCRLVPGEKETRYLKWKDVDYSTTSGVGYYDGLQPPRFRLVDTTTGLTVKDVNGRSLDLSGAELGGPNQYKEIAAEFIGGHLYEWHWYNIVGRDGIAFWVPYDDFPSLVGGCGTYNQKIGLQGTRGAGWANDEVKATGGDTVRFRIAEDYIGGNAAAPTTTTRATLTPAAGFSFDGTFENSPAINISDDGKPDGSRAKTIWKLPGMGPGSPYVSQRSLYFSYKIKANAQDGARHCFNASLEPVSNTRITPPLNSNNVCVTIDNSLKPFVSTTGADVHAGDCAVTVDGKFTGLDGKITGPPANGGTVGSSGSYIVSAGDAITNFGSAGSASGGALTFGKGGKYGAICRPKMSTIDENFRKDTAETLNAPAAGTTLNLSTLEGGHRYKMKVTGDIRVSGQSNSTITIYATGQVALTNSPGGPVVGANTSFPAARSKLPVVGIVANSIVIGQSVTTVNAVMYAQNTINTCSISDWVNQCKSTLTVKGFAMAGDFLFRRVSPFANSLQVGEQIDFNAAFYLNPPPGFGLPANQIKYLGEKAPLY